MSNAKKNETIITIPKDKPEVVITREFDAPRALVFRAYVDPELVAQWLGPRDLVMHVEKFDMRDGGSYRYVHSRGKDRFGFHGMVHEVTAPERIIQTFEYEGRGERGHVSLECATFEDLPGSRTRVTGKSVYLSVEKRDQMIDDGMEEGVRDGFERLAELLERL